MFIDSSLDRQQGFYYIYGICLGPQQVENENSNPAHRIRIFKIQCEDYFEFTKWSCTWTQPIGNKFTLTQHNNLDDSMRFNVFIKKNEKMKFKGKFRVKHYEGPFDVQKFMLVHQERISQIELIGFERAKGTPFIVAKMKGIRLKILYLNEDEGRVVIIDEDNFITSACEVNYWVLDIERRIWNDYKIPVPT